MQPTLRVTAVLSFIVAIIWMIVDPGFEPITVALAGIASLITSFAIEKSKSEPETLDQRNRRVMLDHVDNFWVKGILEKSLHGVAMLELGKKEDTTAVNYPWGIKKTSTNETLPAGKSMLEIFKEIGLGRSLLVLGSPGSGKSTMLYELTRQLIEGARKDETEPIPVVFNLSSWTEKLSFADWLAEQLNVFYYVPKKTAQKLVTDNKMFLLLDGLDEVKEDLREKRVEVINQFKTEHGLTPLVICSRIEEYQAIQTKLSLAGAITLQPLTSEQVNTYFDNFGKSLSSLKQILKKDKILQELTKTPLMLSVMVLAYKDVNIKEIPELKDIKEQRKHLFDTYIDRMFERPTRLEKKDFSKEETRHYLSWLAYQMVKHNLITYQIEGMQPSWLEGNKQSLVYKWGSGLIFGLIYCGLFLGLISSFSYVELNFGLFFGVLFTMLIALVLGLRDTQIEMVDKLRWSWTGAISKIIVSPKNLLLIILSSVFVGMLSGELLSVLSIVMLIALLNLVLIGLNTEQIEKTNYPEQRLRRTFYNLIYSLMIFSLIGMLMLGLFFGLNNVQIEKMNYLEQELSPTSFYNLLTFGMKFALFLMLETIPILVLFFLASAGLIPGISLIQHYNLRNILIKGKFLPRKLVPFLNYCVDLIFIRRVGGSYIFVHRLLMEHFAEMYVEKENK